MTARASLFEGIVFMTKDLRTHLRPDDAQSSSPPCAELSTDIAAGWFFLYSRLDGRISDGIQQEELRETENFAGSARSHASEASRPYDDSIAAPAHSGIRAK